MLGMPSCFYTHDECKEKYPNKLRGSGELVKRRVCFQVCLMLGKKLFNSIQKLAASRIILSVIGTQWVCSPSPESNPKAVIWLFRIVFKVSHAVADKVEQSRRGAHIQFLIATHQVRLEFVLPFIMIRKLIAQSYHPF